MITLDADQPHDLRALIIDDDPAVQKSVELILRSAKIASRAVGSGDAGLQAALRKPFDIILLDLTLPDTEGLALLQKLRHAGCQTPILILSGSEARNDRIESLGVGADDYLSKPFDKDELVARIRAIVRRSGHADVPQKRAALTGDIIVRRGAAQPWSFDVAYAPPGTPTPSEAAGGRVPGRRIELRGETLPAPPPVNSGEDADTAPWAHIENAKVIVLGNAKGGTGKSTTAMHLIVALLLDGHRVGSLDLDADQGSLTRYIQNRRAYAERHGIDLPLPEHRTLSAVTASGHELAAALETLDKTCDHILVDTPGHIAARSLQAHGHADVLITPINDSFMDLDILARFDAESGKMTGPSHYSELVTEARRQRLENAASPIDWLVIRNRLSSLDARNKRRVADALPQAAKKLDFRVGPGLSERVIYRELFLSGLTLWDIERPDVESEFTLSHVAARQELRALLDALAGHRARVSGAGDSRAPRAAAAAL